jgi:hypothetical protein
MQHDYMIEPPLPIGASDGIIGNQSPANTGADYRNDVPPHPGSFAIPPTTDVKLAVLLFGLQQGFGSYPKLTRYGLIRLILHDEANDRLLKVVVKDCWSIDKEYIGRDLWMAFPIQNELYLMPHDEMAAAAEAEGISWNARGTCSRSRLSAPMRARCAPYRIAPTLGEAWLARPTSVFTAEDRP